MPAARQVVKIDKGVPVPAPYNAKYPWKSLKINDSFFIPQAQRTQSNLHAAALQSKIKVKTRTVTENGVKGVRVWRIA